MAVMLFMVDVSTATTGGPTDRHAGDRSRIIAGAREFSTIRHLVGGLDIYAQSRPRDSAQRVYYYIVVVIIVVLN